MIRLQATTTLLPNLLLATLVIAAQMGAVLHAFEHDLGAPQSKICTTCATASQLESACTGHQHILDLDPLRPSYIARATLGLRSTPTVVVRQRGPPAPL